MKLDKEMMDAKSDREGYKQECQKYDKECAIKQDFYENLKKNNAEWFQEKTFLEEQIKQAKENQEKLLEKVKKLWMELREQGMEI